MRFPSVTRAIQALVLGLVAALPGSAAADFAAGVTAYDRGNYAAAYREWLPLAERGDPAAQRNVAHLHRKGLGVARDPLKAAEWYRRAAELDFAPAQANLASMYLSGEGVPRQYVEAVKWFERAAHQSHTIAQYNLGLMYERGLGVPRSESTALAWYYNAANGGHKKAAERLSSLVRPEGAGAAVRQRTPSRGAPTGAAPSSRGGPTAPQAGADKTAEKEVPRRRNSFLRALFTLSFGSGTAGEVTP